MKFTVYFKDPDGVWDSLKSAAPDEDTREELSDFISQWVQYSEYVYIEFDTEAGTATVKKRGLN